MIKLLTMGLLSLILLSSPNAHAQETSVSLSGGSIKVGNDTTACAAGNEGNIRYNTATNELEFCNGSAWQETATTSALSIPVCTGVTDHDDVGGTCSDGSIYAGLHYDPGNGGYFALYATDADQTTGSGVQWKTSSGINDLNPENEFYGQTNFDGLLSATTNFPAFETCSNLSRHGHTDWYLPSTFEVDVLFENQNLLTGFGEPRYWASNQTGVAGGARPNFATGSYESNTKTLSNHVHCVRRD